MSSALACARVFSRACDLAVNERPAWGLCSRSFLAFQGHLSKHGPVMATAPPIRDVASLLRGPPWRGSGRRSRQTGLQALPPKQLGLRCTILPLFQRLLSG